MDPHSRDAFADDDVDSFATRQDLEKHFSSLRDALLQMKLEILGQVDSGVQLRASSHSIATTPQMSPRTSKSVEFKNKRESSSLEDYTIREPAKRQFSPARESRLKLSCSTLSGRASDHLQEHLSGFSNRSSLSEAASKPVAAAHAFPSMQIERNTLVAGRPSKDHRLKFSETSQPLYVSAKDPVSAVVKYIVRHPFFEIGCGIVIFFNAILVGVETELLATEGEIPNACNWLQMFLNIWYLIELFLRIYTSGRNFWRGEEASWNLFDTFLVLSAFIDLVILNVDTSSLKSARILRALRLFRVIRTLRIIRQFRIIREFRKMVCSLTSSMTTLFWSLLLVCGVMYTFALWFTQAAAYHRVDHEGSLDEQKVELIENYFKSLSRTFYSLFAAVSGGYSWHVLLDPWVNLGDYWTVTLFFLYISVSVFGLLNIVTSVFVESAMSATKHFQDLLLDERRKDMEMYTNHMERIFHVIDADGGGDISFKEMQVFMNDTTSELPQYMEALGITASDVWVLFKLLDQDNSGSVDIGEFCQGCMRLKGEAKSFDINCILYENRAMLRHSAAFFEFVECRLEDMESNNAQWLLEIDQRLATRLSALEASFCKLRSYKLKRPLTPPRATPDGSCNRNAPFTPMARKLGVSHERCHEHRFVGTLASQPRLLQASSFVDCQ